MEISKKLFSNQSTCRDICFALEAKGSEAEPIVIALLEFGGDFELSQAARVLQKIGTQKSIAPLQKLIQRKTRERRTLSVRAAQQAIQAIKARN